jgi:hypothetical protein
MKLTTFTSSKSQATDYYRSLGPFTRLALQKKFTHIICQQERAQWHDIYNTDIVLIQLPNSTASLAIMADAKRMGKKVIIDFDDYLLEVPEDNPANHYFANPQVQKQIQDTFLFADAVIVSTKKLYDLYFPMCQGKIPMFIIPNGWNPTDLPMFEVKERHTPTRFVWRGGSTHFADLHTIKAEINQMIEMNTEVTFFGLNKFMMYDLNKKAINVDWSSMFVYFTFMQRIEGDFGFYPLVRNDFNLSKSNIFAIECIANGMPVLADSYFPEFNMPGVIKYTDPAQFIEFVTDIVNGNIDKAAAVKAGRNYVKEVLHIDLLNKKRWEILKGI